MSIISCFSFSYVKMQDCRRIFTVQKTHFPKAFLDTSRYRDILFLHLDPFPKGKVPSYMARRFFWFGIVPGGIFVDLTIHLY